MSADPTDDQDDDIAPVTVTLDLMVWAEVCAALQLFVSHESTRECPASRRDALYALREIDRVVMGQSEQAPPDDVLGPGGGE